MSDLGILGGDLSIGPSLASAASGWAQGARALTSAPANAQLAFQRGALSGAQTASALELARERRDKNIALASITPEALANPAMRNVVNAAIIRGGLNLNSAAEGLYTQQKADQQGQLFNAALGGANIEQLNPGLAVLHGQPVKVAAVEGNTLIDPYALPSGQAAVGGNTPTAVGLGDIAAANARAAASYASAGASNARAKRELAGIGADKAANYEIVTDDTGNAARINKLTGEASPVMIGDMPLAMAAKGGSGKSGPSLPSPEQMKQAFGSDKVGGGANDDARAFIEWQALQAQRDPRFNNGNFALQQYVLHQSGAAQAGDQTASDADALGLGDVALNHANARGTPIKNDKGQVIALPTASRIVPSLGEAAGASGGDGSAPAESAYSKENPATPTTQAEFDKLKPGTPYRNPSDGKLYVKN